MAATARTPIYEVPIDIPGHVLGPGRGLKAYQLSVDTMIPNEKGVYEMHRRIKEGEVSKRTRKTKSWKPVFMVLRPNYLSIYRDKEETKLRHRIQLSDLTAVARQKDAKRKEKHIFGLFSPSRNYHLEAPSDSEAQAWVEVIRREARIDEHEEEIMLASPGGAHTSPYQGFERSIDAQPSAGAEERGLNTAGYASSSDADNLSPNITIPGTRTNESTPLPFPARQPSYAEYSGAEGRTSMSDFSDAGGPVARLSALSLAGTLDPRPSTSSTQPVPNTIYSTSVPTRPAAARNTSQLSNLNIATPSSTRPAPNPQDQERVLYNSYAYLLKQKTGVRQWKKVWLVVRPKGLALYKNEDEYAALLVLSIGAIIDAVEIDAVSRSKVWCMQILTEERNYRFSVGDEEGLTRCLGALKSLGSQKRRKRKEMEGVGGT